jgi:hypothetical protein
MLYHVSRNGQMYGPYTIEDLQRYVLSGNVLATDLAKSDAAPEWIPVHQILNAAGLGGFAGAPAAYPVAPAYAAADLSAYPDAPNLPWGLVLLFNVLTCGLFMAVWNIIVSAWMKRVQPTSQAMIYYIAGYGLLLLSSGASYNLLFAVHHHHLSHHHPLTGIVALAGWVVRLIARFTMKANLEEHFNGPEPLGLRLNGAMTFFFGGLYHQYHLNRINEMKNAIRYQRAAL